MCEYCKGKSKLLYIETEYDLVLLDVYISNGSYLWEKTNDIGIKINYCPFCGRKLGDYMQNANVLRKCLMIYIKRNNPCIKLEIDQIDISKNRINKNKEDKQ